MGTTGEEKEGGREGGRGFHLFILPHLHFLLFIYDPPLLLFLFQQQKCRKKEIKILYEILVLLLRGRGGRGGQQRAGRRGRGKGRGVLGAFLYPRFIITGEIPLLTFELG